jgi:hypothetical protein
MILNKVSAATQTELLEGLSPREHEYEPGTVLLNSADAKKLIEKAYERGFNIIHIECWTSRRLEYFTTHCKDLFITRHKIADTNWAQLAFNEIMQEYTREVLDKFPHDEPLFSIEFA